MKLRRFFRKGAFYHESSLDQRSHGKRNPDQVQPSGHGLFRKPLYRLRTRVQVLLRLFHEAFFESPRAVGAFRRRQELAENQKCGKICRQKGVYQLGDRSISTRGGKIRQDKIVARTTSRQRDKDKHRDKIGPDSPRPALDKDISTRPRIVVAQHTRRVLSSGYGPRRKRRTPPYRNEGILRGRHTHHMLHIAHFSRDNKCAGPHRTSTGTMQPDMARKSESPWQLSTDRTELYKATPPAAVPSVRSDLSKKPSRLLVRARPPNQRILGEKRIRICKRRRRAMRRFRKTTGDRKLLLPRGNHSLREKENTAIGE